MKEKTEEADITMNDMEIQVRPECREIITEQTEEAFLRQKGSVHTTK